MDQADKLKLTKFGFHLNLLGASFSLSVLGIIVSIIGIIGSIICFVLALVVAMDNVGTISIGAFIIMIPYLAMWILLKIKTNKKDIPGIERIGKVYSYVSGSLEIIAMIAVIIHILLYDSVWTEQRELIPKLRSRLSLLQTTTTTNYS